MNSLEPLVQKFASDAFLDTGLRFCRAAELAAIDVFAKSGLVS